MHTFAKKNAKRCRPRWCEMVAAVKMSCDESVEAALVVVVVVVLVETQKNENLWA